MAEFTYASAAVGIPSPYASQRRPSPSVNVAGATVIASTGGSGHGFPASAAQT